MIYIVSPSGQIFEKPFYRFYKVFANYTEIYDREGGRLFELLPKSWWATYNPPYKEPAQMSDDTVIRFIRGCHPVTVASVKRELRKFNARELEWDA